MSKENPAHYCNCGKYLGFRGFCSDKCHDEGYEIMTGCPDEMEDVYDSN